ncbi:MAG: hypothetical protein Q8K92_08220 [Leadbetterella sp.]|nr:hypothetical protein [Leadbetterella sp.]
MKEYLILMMIGVVVGVLGLLVSIAVYVVMARAKKKSELELKEIFAKQQYEWRERERKLINDFRGKLDYLAMDKYNKSLAVPGEFQALARIMMPQEKLDPIQPGQFSSSISPYADFMVRQFERNDYTMVGDISNPNVKLEHLKRRAADYLAEWLFKNDFLTVRLNDRKNAFEVGICYYSERDNVVA